MTDDPVGTPGPRDPMQQVRADIDLLDGLDLAEQVPVYERVHAGLTAALAGTVDQAGTGGR